MTELLKQGQFSPLKTEEQVAIIYSGVNGYLDDIEVDQVGAFEAGLLAHMRNDNQDVLDTIRDEGALSDETAEKLKAAVDAFAKSFG